MRFPDSRSRLAAGSDLLADGMYKLIERDTLRAGMDRYSRNVASEERLSERVITHPIYRHKGFSA